MYIYSNINILLIFIEIFLTGHSCRVLMCLLGGIRQQDSRYPVFGTVICFICGTCYRAVLFFLMYNIGSSVALLMHVQRFMNVALIIGALFVFLFIFKRFDIKQKWLYGLCMLIACILLVVSFMSSLNLVYRFEIIEPVIESSGVLPSRIFWLIAWIFSACAYLLKAVKGGDAKEKRLDFMSGVASLFIAGGFVAFLLYIMTGHPLLILLSWTVILFAFLAFLLAD